MTEVAEILAKVVADVGGSPREGQQEMAARVALALAREEHVLVQAGTGTGKSFGYLVPVLEWTARTGKRAIISTATLALQRQIMTSDAPRVVAAVREIAGTHPNVALLKGWNNYVCLRKATGGYPEEGTLISRAEGKLGASATGVEVVRARDWAMGTETGDRDDLVPGVSDRAWAQISLPKRECIGDKCPLQAQCFPMLARAAAEEADVVVTNHAMLGIAAQGMPVLPQADAYVIDEAHDLVDRVTSQLTMTMSKYDLSGIAKMARRVGIETVDLEAASDELDEVLVTLGEGRFVEVSNDLGDALSRVNGAAHEIGERAGELSSKVEEEAISKQILRSRLAVITEITDAILGGEVADESKVAWVSGDSPAYLNLAPLDVAAPIADKLFEGRATVLTSATLTIGGQFEPMATKVGLAFPSQGTWHGIDVGTPFDPVKQGVLYVARHLPEPTKDGYGDPHFDEMTELIEASGGGALGLFTSRSGAERAAEYVRDRIDLPIFVQGEDQLSTLVEQFAADPSASLFGTVSLWQGVDVPGLTNRLVIIDRIPFPRPNDPLIAARSQAADRSGGNGFMQVSAAHAALLLAQGAGRLLRRLDDRGVVAVLDSRILTKRYGSFLLASLPAMWRTTDPEVVRGALGRLGALVGDDDVSGEARVFE